mmetsp:Transcript_12505/g.29724  ORF Transcript_12505/g.29724 Transcript_12505/m.29724 type:complete len:151 (+) Transcript_12505:226-678(+)
MRHNVEANCLGAVCSVEELDWAGCRQGQAPCKLARRQFDTVIAGDVLYSSRLAGPFLGAVLCHLREGGLLLLGHQVRHAVYLCRETGQARVESEDEPLEDFRRMSRDLGFVERALRRQETAPLERRSPTDGPALLLAFSRDELALGRLPG